MVSSIDTDRHLLYVLSLGMRMNLVLQFGLIEKNNLIYFKIRKHQWFLDFQSATLQEQAQS